MKQLGMDFSENTADNASESAPKDVSKGVAKNSSRDLSKNSPKESMDEPQAGSNQPKVFSVSDINGGVRRILEANYPLVWVQGEISNFVAHGSGHFYFSLKDKKSQISAVMFRGHNSRLKFKPKTGMEVLVRGKITVYEPRGNYQLFCELMEPVGAGAMQQQFEQLKEKLRSEGLFEASLKKPLPSFPKHIAVVTSPTGAAIKDIINVLKRRNRTAKVTVIPAVVQGKAAPQSVVAGIRKAQQLGDVDVLIVGRGGGSMEDLWGFNDEQVARAIVACKFPVVSAVGHEVDYTIADFVSDLRAPTPSSAAELVVKNVDDLVEKLHNLESRLFRVIGGFFTHLKNSIKNFESRLVDPQRQLQQRIQRVDELTLRLSASITRGVQRERSRVQLLRQKLGSPKQVVLKEQRRLEGMQFQLRTQITKKLETARRRWSRSSTMLEGISPLKVVERGYSIVSVAGQVVKTASDLTKGQQVSVRLAKGSFTADVVEVFSEENK